MGNVVLLDIDGVVGPMGANPCYEGESVWAKLPPGRMHFSKNIVERLKQLHSTGLAEFRWLSSWQDEAVQLASALSLPAWPAYTKADRPTDLLWLTDWWKEAVVSDLVRRGHSVVWCEDNIPYQANTMALNAYRDSLLCIAPNSGLGLTLQDLTTIEEWLRSR